MRKKVVAIGLDAADPDLIERWIDAGHLPTLQKIRENGVYGRLTNIDRHRAEVPWTSFLSGCLPQKTGYWTPVKFRPQTYDPSETRAYKFDEYPPFYALGEDYKVAVFDMPQTALSEAVNGLQVLAWGAHSPQTPSHSIPENLLSELEAKHGRHPVLNKDFADCRDIKALQGLKRGLEKGITRRSSICRDLLQRDDWDLFLTIFGETHSAGHSFWHLSQPHPLELETEDGSDSLLDVFKACDKTVGEILEGVDEETYVVVFSVHGMEANVLDLTSRLFLPEILYRWSFNGEKAISTIGGEFGKAVKPPVTNFRNRGWMGDVWSLKHDQNPIRGFLRRNAPTGLFQKFEKLFGTSTSPRLESPYEQMKGSDGLFYMPANWYKQYWPQMKAFALPSHSEGCVRINLKGREKDGIVEPGDYQATCDELCRLLKRLLNPRTNKPMVEDIIRTRETGFETDPKLPDSDLLVMWSYVITDTIDSPELGRLGPVPYHRTGSHRSHGFAMVNGPGIEENSSFPTCDAVNLPATILELIGAPIPEHFDGAPILKQPVEVV